MTVSAAAICTLYPSSGGWENAVLAISDRMITAGDIEYEPGGNCKISWLGVPECPGKILALVSGDAVSHGTIVSRTLNEVLAHYITDVGAVAKRYADNFAALRREQAERASLHPLGLSLDSFLDAQADMNQGVVNDAMERLRSHHLGVEAIIAGMDSTGAHIYTVGGFNEYGEEKCYETCHDAIGFCAVGIGGRHFESQYMVFQYNRIWALANAVLLMYMAKKKAEVAPGVGAATDMHYIDNRIAIALPDEYKNALDEHYEAHSQTVLDAWITSVERMAADERLIARPAPPAPTQQANEASSVGQSDDSSGTQESTPSTE